VPEHSREFLDQEHTVFLWSAADRQHAVGEAWPEGQPARDRVDGGGAQGGARCDHRAHTRDAERKQADECDVRSAQLDFGSDAEECVVLEALAHHDAHLIFLRLVAARAGFALPAQDADGVRLEQRHKCERGEEEALAGEHCDHTLAICKTTEIIRPLHGAVLLKFTSIPEIRFLMMKKSCALHVIHAPMTLIPVAVLEVHARLSRSTQPRRLAPSARVLRSMLRAERHMSSAKWSTMLASRAHVMIKKTYCTAVMDEIMYVSTTHMTMKTELVFQVDDAQKESPNEYHASDIEFRDSQHVPERGRPGGARIYISL
jgi:hypothetical protein